VELENSAMLEDAMALARVYKQHLAMTRDNSVRAKPSPYRASARQLALPAPPSSTTTKDTAGAVTPAMPRLKRLTPAEMTAKREKGECYNCIEPFSQGHLKVRPMKGIFRLQMNDEPALEETGDPYISLHMITGLSCTETMQLAVRLNDNMLCALVDSGSTHSFIWVFAASRLHLSSQPLPGLHVSVANGDRVACAGVCRTVCIFID
jgi:hypothetical protein